MKTLDEINRLIGVAEAELIELESKRSVLLGRVAELKRDREVLNKPLDVTDNTHKQNHNNQSTQDEKIALFRTLFRGRDDVYPRRFESLKTGKTGYQPVCQNEWVRGICEKPRIRCEDCGHREFLPVTDLVVRNHLQGFDPQDKTGRTFTIGVYPMLPDETCWFLAADFDKASWQQDVQAFLETCSLFNVPAAIERSRSGNGVTSGYSLLSLSLHPRRAKWVLSCFRKQWSAGQRLGWTRMTVSSQARIHCPRAALAI